MKSRGWTSLIDFAKFNFAIFREKNAKLSDNKVNNYKASGKKVSL